MSSLAATRPELEPLDQQVPPPTLTLLSQSGQLDEVRESLRQAIEQAEPALAQLALEPLLKRLAGADWQLVVNNSYKSYCDSDDKRIHLGLDSWKKLNSSARAALIEVIFLHELGHALYTPEQYDSVEMVARSHSDDPVLLSAQEFWLDNMVTDAHLRVKLIQALPERREAVELDRLYAVLSNASDCCISVGLDYDGKSTSGALAALPNESQIEVLLLARLNEHPETDEWLSQTDAVVRDCFAELAPWIDRVRDGSEHEYATLLPDLYEVLVRHDLVPIVGVSKYQCEHPELSEGGIEMMTWVLETLGRTPRPEPVIAPDPQLIERMCTGRDELIIVVTNELQSLALYEFGPSALHQPVGF